MTKKLFKLATIASLLLLFCINTPAVFAAQSQHYSNQAEKDYRAGIKHQNKNNISAAIKALRKAGHQGHEKAQYHLAILYYQQKQYKKARYWLQKRAKAGEADAQYHYANTYRFSLGTKQQPAIARRLYQKAAKQGHVHAQFELAKMYQQGLGAKQSTNRAAYWYKKAAKSGHANAKEALRLLRPTKLAKPHQPKSTKPSKPVTPQPIKQRPAEPETPNHSEKLLGDAINGDPEGQYHLAMRYLLAYEIDADSQKAIYWLTKAAEKKHPMAEYQLADQYFKGRNTQQDIALAVHYFHRAHIQGVKAADTALKVISDHGFESLVRAEMGDSEAQYQLALQYLQENTAQDKKTAFQWLESSAKQSHIPALLQLAHLYKVGKIIKKDQTKAFDYYQQAAELENPEAQFSLSQMYQTGKGVEINPTLANSWLNRAASQGFPAAIEAQQFSELE